MFVLMLATDYEGEMLLGVYSSEERAWSEASAFLERRGRQLHDSEGFEVREVELDADAQYHW